MRRSIPAAAVDRSGRRAMDGIEQIWEVELLESFGPN
jgi:hypothetical protein